MNNIKCKICNKITKLLFHQQKNNQLNKKKNTRTRNIPPKQTHLAKKKNIFLEEKKNLFSYLVATQMNFIKGKISKRKWS